MEKHRASKEVINRLARIEGHVRSIKEMVAEGRDCPDLLIQIAAVRAALDQVGRLILEDHMESCIIRAVKAGAGHEAIGDLKDALAKFIR